jgi:hypothetical protein
MNDTVTYCVNVNVDTLNTPDGDPDCRKHGYGAKGAHFDITIHRSSCEVIKNTEKSDRYWEHSRRQRE